MKGEIRRDTREFTSRILYLKNYLSTGCLRCQYTYAQVFISRFTIDDNIGTLLFGF